MTIKNVDVKKTDKSGIYKIELEADKKTAEDLINFLLNRLDRRLYEIKLLEAIYDFKRHFIDD